MLGNDVVETIVLFYLAILAVLGIAIPSLLWMLKRAHTSTSTDGWFKSYLRGDFYRDFE